MSTTDTTKITRKYTIKKDVIYGRPRLNRSPESVRQSVNNIAIKSYYKKQGLTPEDARAIKAEKALAKVQRKEEIANLKIAYKKIILLPTSEIKSIVFAINLVI